MWFWLSLIALLCWSGSDLFSKIGCRDEDDRLSHLKMVMAVGVVIGGAFNKIVSVFVSSIITPIIGYLTSGVNLAYLTLKLGDVELKYGELLQATIDFIIIAFSIFVAIKLIGSLRRKSEETPAAPAPKPDDVVLLEQIRDILQKQADVK